MTPVGVVHIMFLVAFMCLSMFGGSITLRIKSKLSVNIFACNGTQVAKSNLKHCILADTRESK